MRHEKFFPPIGDEDEALAACLPPSILSVEASASRILPVGHFTPWPTVDSSTATQWESPPRSAAELSSLLESMLDAVVSLLVRRLLAEQIAVASLEKDR